MSSSASAPAVPLILRWQGVLANYPAGQLGRQLTLISGIVLCALMAGLPLVTRTGMTLLIAASGLLWVLIALRTPAGDIGSINRWLLGIIALALLATGFSPVPSAALHGFLKLLSYLGVYALMRQLLATEPIWWDRIVAALLAGQLVTSVLGIRQLFGDTSELARWADPNSVADGTIRIYGTLDNPNLLAGYLLPAIPLALVALLRWPGMARKAFALAALLLGIAALVLTYSRGAWMGLVAEAAVVVVLLGSSLTHSWPPLWRRLFPLLLLVLGAAALVVVVTQVEPLRVRVLSLVAGRNDSSNNFRINVWLAALDMIQARPWLGIGPGNDAFNQIYPLFAQPRFNALSAYSIPLELSVEAGIPGLLAGIGLVLCCLRSALGQWGRGGFWALPALAVLAVIAGLGVQGLTDTIFFRPEVQLSGWFCVATLAAAPTATSTPPNSRD
ncbi:IctB family putative bicarbonate transporter [Cyanobium sp. HWJ4-Hawea]|uniref:IctB family putative bicarbonate transporter n=1 Tax=Cyanobium sp. HWJ4-Hawea TaxID=2823713 RepID=UPI0020CD084C|nr:IctB family putative bicarbonate transporter [Cyanobium sp. HWJ4-Hawea]MCP9808927.1 IctB family putative bicarbonate transporter [Cyanobium sp. HWJ4-Hawea]